MDFIYRFDALGSAAHTNAGERVWDSSISLVEYNSIHPIINIWDFNIGINDVDRAVTDMKLQCA